MDIKIFTELVKEELEKITECHLEINCTVKNNGVVLTGIEFKDSDINIAPVFYMEGYYKAFQNGSSTFVEAGLQNNCVYILIGREEYKDFLNEYSYEEIKKAQECILAYEEIDTEDELYEYYREWLGTINKETLYTIYRGLDVFVEFSQFEWELLLALQISNEREVEILLDSVFVMQKVNRLEENISDYIQLTKIVSGRKDNERAFIKEELINEILKSFTFDILFDLRECFEKMKVCGKNELISEETWKKFCVLLVFVKEEEQLKKINSFIKKKEKAKTDI